MTEYRKAIDLDPADTTAPAQLAKLQLDKKKDRAGAEATMDALLKAQPESIPVRMARYRVLQLAPGQRQAIARRDRARQPAGPRRTGSGVRLGPDRPHGAMRSPPHDAIQRRDFDRAKRHLDAIPQDQANELKVRTLRGMLEYNERHPDEAIEQWRRGLVSVGGTDLELTWQLAHTLIQLGKVNDARPLISQFQRLGGPERDAMGRLLRALSDQQAGRHAAAIKELNRIADQLPASSQYEAYLALGRCHEALAEEGQALLAYQKAVVIATSLNSSAAEPRRGISRITANKNPDRRGDRDGASPEPEPDRPGPARRSRAPPAPAADAPPGKPPAVGWCRRSIVDRALKLDPEQLRRRKPCRRMPWRLRVGLARRSRCFRSRSRALGKQKLEIWLTYVGSPRSPEPGRGCAHRARSGHVLPTRWATTLRSGSLAPGFWRG